MSMSSQVYFGYFIKAKRVFASQDDTIFACSANHDHPCGNPAPNFCPECGSRMEWVKVVGEVPIDMWELQCGGSYDWINELHQADIDWINETFSATDTFSVDGEDDYDYIMCKGYEDVDGLDSGVHQMSISEITTPPTLEDIKRLQKLMRYETTELTFGALVSVSS